MTGSRGRGWTPSRPTAGLMSILECELVPVQHPVVVCTAGHVREVPGDSHTGDDSCLDSRDCWHSRYPAFVLAGGCAGPFTIMLAAADAQEEPAQAGHEEDPTSLARIISGSAVQAGADQGRAAPVTVPRACSR